MTASARMANLQEPGFVGSHTEFLEPTAHTTWNGDVTSAAERVATLGGDDVVGVVLAVFRLVHTSLRYTPGATTPGDG